MSRRKDRSKEYELISNKDGVSSFVNQRKEKFADYLIDVSKYVLTGVVITSLFNDVTDKTIIYLIGMFVVIFSLWAGLRLTNKKKAE